MISCRFALFGFMTKTSLHTLASMVDDREDVLLDEKGDVHQSRQIFLAGQSSLLKKFVWVSPDKGRRGTTEYMTLKSPRVLSPPPISPTLLNFGYWR